MIPITYFNCGSRSKSSENCHKRYSHHPSNEKLRKTTTSEQATKGNQKNHARNKRKSPGVNAEHGDKKGKNLNAKGSEKGRKNKQRIKEDKEDPKMTENVKDILTKYNIKNKNKLTKQELLNILMPLVAEQLKGEIIQNQKILNALFSQEVTPPSNIDFENVNKNGKLVRNHNVTDDGKKVVNDKMEIPQIKVVKQVDKVDVNLNKADENEEVKKKNNSEVSTMPDDSKEIVHKNLMDKIESKGLLSLSPTQNEGNNEEAGKVHSDEHQDKEIIILKEKFTTQLPISPNFPPPPLNNNNEKHEQTFGSFLLSQNQNKTTLQKRTIRDLNKEKLQKALKLKNPRPLLQNTQGSTSTNIKSNNNSPVDNVDEGPVLE
uniref:EF-hand domain-containing protein n=1 Tax=Parastrongyloides trichosuri TaxID=131310 RepID=A0A0N4ZMY7_PARTI